MNTNKTFKAGWLLLLVATVLGLISFMFFRNILPASNTPCPSLYPNATPPEVIGTPTPLPFSKSVDLAGGLPDEEKTRYIIRRANCNFEEYLFSSQLQTHEEIMKTLMLQEGDVILWALPVVPIYSTPPMEVPHPLEYVEFLNNVLTSYCRDGGDNPTNKIPAEACAKLSAQMSSVRQLVFDGKYESAIPEVIAFQALLQDPSLTPAVKDDLTQLSQFLIDLLQ